MPLHIGKNFVYEAFNSRQPEWFLRLESPFKQGDGGGGRPGDALGGRPVS